MMLHLILAQNRVLLLLLMGEHVKGCVLPWFSRAVHQLWLPGGMSEVQFSGSWPGQAGTPSVSCY